MQSSLTGRSRQTLCSLQELTQSGSSAPKVKAVSVKLQNDTEKLGDLDCADGFLGSISKARSEKEVVGTLDSTEIHTSAL